MSIDSPFSAPPRDPPYHTEGGRKHFLCTFPRVGKAPPLTFWGRAVLAEIACTLGSSCEALSLVSAKQKGEAVAVPPRSGIGPCVSAEVAPVIRFILFTLIL